VDVMSADKSMSMMFAPKAVGASDLEMRTALQQLTASAWLGMQLRVTGESVETGHILLRDGLMVGGKRYRLVAEDPKGG
jgi:hypothetical protein